MTIEVAVAQIVSLLQATLAQMNLSNAHELQAPARTNLGLLATDARSRSSLSFKSNRQGRGRLASPLTHIGCQHAVLEESCNDGRTSGCFEGYPSRSTQVQGMLSG